MKQTFFTTIGVVMFVIIFSTNMTLAHEVHTYQIGDKKYEIVVGSLNEPVVVDDKTGVELRVAELVARTDEHADEEAELEEKVAVENLNQTLKVEMIAGNTKKITDISPVFGTPGAYKNLFYPTVPTTLSYRFFGTIGDTPIDLTFVCNPAGHPVTPEDTNPTPISEGVTRLSKRGAFGCPQAKADFGFPEAANASNDFKGQVATSLAETTAKADSSRSLAMVGIVLGVLGLVTGIGAWRKDRQS